MAGLIALLVGMALSGWELSRNEISLEWKPLAIAGILGFVSLFLAMIRFRILAAGIGQYVTFRQAASVVVWGGIANILPLPGAFMVRVGYLSRTGGLKRASLVNMMGLAVWFLMAAVVALVLALQASDSRVTQFLTVVLAASGTAMLVLRYAADSGYREIFWLAIVQSVMIIVSILRLALVAMALGSVLPLLWVSLIALSGIAASATGVFPAGLGLSETLAASVAVIGGLSPALAFMMSALNRFLSWLALLLFLPFVTRPNALGEAGEASS